MKIYFGGQDPILELNAHQKAILAYNIHVDEMEKDLARRCEYWIHLPAWKHAHINKNKYKDKLAKSGVRSMPLDPIECAVKCYEVNFEPIPFFCKVGNTEFQFKPAYQLVNMGAKEVLKKDLLKHWDGTAGSLEERVSWLMRSFHGYQGDFEKALKWVDRVPNPDKDFPDAAIASISETQDLERMIYILKHKYEKCLERLKLEWNPKLASRRITEIPTDDVEYCNLVFSQADYKDKAAKDAERKRIV